MSSGAAPAVSWYVPLLVRHPKWGLGKIVAVSEDILKSYFRDLAEEKPSDALKTIKPRQCELRVAEVQSDPWLNNIPALVDDKMPVSKPRLTVQHQMSLFKNLYPLAFGDPTYLQERNCNWEAHLAYVEQLGDGDGSKLLEDYGPGAVSETVLRVIRRSNHLNMHEALAFQNSLADNSSNGLPRRFALHLKHGGASHNRISATVLTNTERDRIVSDIESALDEAGTGLDLDAATDAGLELAPRPLPLSDLDDFGPRSHIRVGLCLRVAQSSYRDNASRFRPRSRATMSR